MCKLNCAVTAQHHGEQLVHQEEDEGGGLQRGRGAAVQGVRLPDAVPRGASRGKFI